MSTAQVNGISRPQQQQAGTSARVQEQRAQRRRRDDQGPGRLRNLAIQGNIDPNYEYRFVNDDPGRLYQLTKQDDWDVVNGSDLEPDSKDRGIGSKVERVVDKRTGKKAVLVRKLKEYYAADKRKEQAAIDATEAVLRRGATPGAKGLSAEEGASAYVPMGGIQIGTPAGGKPYTP
jgi:hypothetical protein